MIVLKIGGRQLAEADFLAGLAEVIGSLAELPVIVHGGGKGTSQLSERLGLQPRFVAGQRYTDAAALQVAIMGLVGEASTQLVRALVGHGLAALGLSGVDAGLVTVDYHRIPEGDLGLVGKPVEVRADRLRALSQAGFVPCLAPISLTRDGQPLNVNADIVASAVAGALDARAMVFLTDTPGILHGEASLPELSVSQSRELVQRGVIGEGMIPKVESAAEALKWGVSRVFITNLAGLRSWCQGDRPATEVIAD